MDLQLEGKRALVTGSNSGIGEAIARRLGAEGVSVVIHGRDQERAEAVARHMRDEGCAATAVTGGLMDRQSVEAVGRAALDAYEGLDILVNNAGGRTIEAHSDWSAVDPAVWADAYQLNVIAPATLIGMVLPGMRQRQWGRVVQISSIASYEPRAQDTEYAAAKAALGALTVSLSKELAGTGITANVVSPGAIKTPAVAKVLESEAKRLGWSDDPVERERQAVAARWPSAAQRLGLPEEIAAAIALLVSPLGGFTNGANHRVDGGKSGVVL